MKVWANRTIYSEEHLGLKPAVVYDDSKIEFWDGKSSHGEISSSGVVEKPTKSAKKPRINS